MQKRQRQYNSKTPCRLKRAENAFAGSVRARRQGRDILSLPVPAGIAGAAKCLYSLFYRDCAPVFCCRGDSGLELYNLFLLFGRAAIALPLLTARRERGRFLPAAAKRQSAALSIVFVKNTGFSIMCVFC